MEGYSRKDDGCPQLLDLIPKDREWVRKRTDETSDGVSEEKKLELTLGPPSGEWRVFPLLQNTHFSAYVQSGQGQVAANKESCSNRNRGVAAAAAEKKAFSAVHSSATAQKRSAPAPASVVGWPPIGSFRKNMSSCSKEASDGDRALVKINMDGIPIGRKVDLNACNSSYEKLSLAVDQLFRGLVAAQKNGGIKEKEEDDDDDGGKLLDGSGEYTLIYEDNEGDRLLVGDVPWHMFVSTVKRLRVLKSSELPALSHRSKLSINV